ncbi:MAG: UDP-2,3-diacylglucosamine diphosphatase [Gammaproteobacteria bacterium]|jgi:UDP-2,3-diacylglucosamine hydrolase
MRKTLFIADLHLSYDQPEVTERFFQFLQTKVMQADALYILGDFFNLWVGDDDENAFNRAVINALRKCVDGGVPIYFMPGNRDFLVGKRFFQASGCRLLPDPCIVNLYGVRTLLAHGDIFCVNDFKYFVYRFIVRNWLIKKIFLWLPLPIRKTIANKAREISQNYNASLSQSAYDVAQTAVKRIMRKYKANLIIHGHIHHVGDYKFELDGNLARRIMLGDWDQHIGNALVCQPSIDQQSLDLQFIEIK